MALGASANASHATKRADRRAYAWRAPGRGASRATAPFVVECPLRRGVCKKKPAPKKKPDDDLYSDDSDLESCDEDDE